MTKALLLLLFFPAIQAHSAPAVDCQVEPRRALALINSYRVGYGLVPLRLDVAVSEAALKHAHDMAYHNVLSHQGSDGSTFRDRIQNTGYAAAAGAENIGAGQKNFQQALGAWKRSKGYNENLLNPRFTDVGIALACNPNTRFVKFWVLNFAKAEKAAETNSSVRGSEKSAEARLPALPEAKQ